MMFLAFSIPNFLDAVFRAVTLIFSQSQFLTLFWVFMAVSFLAFVPLLIRRFLRG